MDIETLIEQLHSEMVRSLSRVDLINIGIALGVKLEGQFQEDTHELYADQIKRVSAMLIYRCIDMNELATLCHYCYLETDNLKFEELNKNYPTGVEFFQNKPEPRRSQAKRIEPMQPIPPEVKPARRYSKTPTPLPIPKPNLKHLTERIVRHFDLTELAILCMSLGIRYDQIAGDTIDAKAHYLVLYFERRLEIDRLVDECQKERPKADWDVYE